MGTSRQTVLVVDDNADSADSFADLLALDGYQVHVAYDGYQALERVAGQCLAACFIDIGMPGMNGYELAEQLRSRMPDDGPLLIAVTGWGQREDRERSKRAGFDLHLTKPVDFSAALQLLKEHQGRSLKPHPA